MVQVIQQRVAQLGGTVQPALAADTTHVVCNPDIAASKVAEKLAGWNGPCEEVVVGKGIVLQVPQGVAFVTPDWVSRSIAKQRRRPVESFLPASLAPAPFAAPAAAPAAAEQAVKERGAVPQQQPVSSTVTAAFNPQELAAAQEVQQECRVERRGSEFVAVQGVKPQYTGGDTGLPWGACGVWDEPFDPTVDTLRTRWYRTPGAGQAVQGASPQAAAPASRLNGVCQHVCCARRPFCLVDKLDAFKRSVYVEGRDQFQIKAIDKAIQQLIMWTEPLDTLEDVERVPGVGKKSVGKIVEILETGASSRVEAAAADEDRQVINLFIEVWGTGTKTATKWFGMGLRTLDDLRACPDIRLSEQQKVGLKYFDDMAHKIPRAEVAQAEAIVRRECFDVVERWGGAADVERTFCHATGSYRRGKPESSDIDMLICLPPSLAGADPHAFLAQLLTQLLERGLLLEEMNPRQPGGTGDHASWMGLARPPGARYARRIDVKVYRPEATTFAINYFANSQAFCRATRYWANWAVREAAQRYNPAATGFKLTDIKFVPMRKTGRGRASGSRGSRRRESSSESEGCMGTAGGTEELEPALACLDETALFRELGLAYVPVHMRFFHDFF